MAYNLVQDEEEAADLAQEAFMRAWQALPNYRAEARFSTWLYRIVHNLGLNRLEVLQRRPPPTWVSRTSASDKVGIVCRGEPLFAPLEGSS